ncbi:MAG: Kazal-type serine protease inhibitor domain-containing protein [Thermoanaerobaculia bacterium]|nr:Kazal-type serine protease inhibitor domain-containing protein [Thermoanaerobaculia bacterium]
MTRRSLIPMAMLVVALGVTVGCKPEPAEPACNADADCEIGQICEEATCQVAVCPDVYDPVCGEDGNTYANACEARAAHVAVAHEGECPVICGGIQGILCPDPESQVCDLPPGICLGADLQGVCVDRPEVCPEVFDPVCGCDGQTYSNDCFRLMAGVQKDHDGECEGGGEL